MKFLCCVLLCAFLAKETCGGVLSFLDPFNISSVVEKGATMVEKGIEADAKLLEKGVDMVGKGIDTDMRLVQQGAAMVGQEVDSDIEMVGKGIDSDIKTVEKIDNKITKGTTKLLKKVHKGVFDIEKGFVDGVDEVIGTPIDLKEVHFYLATAENYDKPSRIDYFKPKDVAETNGTIYFIIHGWMSNRNASWFRDLSEILVKGHPDAHVVQVNWDRPASDNYAFSAYDTESVGELVGILVNRLVSEYKVPSEKIVLIGHSLGGQICGWVGKKFKAITGKRLPRIVALDPAGPLFLLRPDSKRLNKHDAEVVMVVHSDGDKLGFGFPCGTIDFFPNGGDSQPGCWTINLGKISTYTEPVTCDHSRAWDFFVEAVNSTGSFAAKKCKSFSDFKKNVCEATIVAMGDLETTETGTFYLVTNAEKPYSIFQKIVDDIKVGIEHIKDDFEKFTHSSSMQGKPSPQSSVDDKQKSPGTSPAITQEKNVETTKPKN